MMRILILGGGFGGVRLAQRLSRMRLVNVHIRLVDPKSYMAYKAAVYRFVTGRSPMECCIPYTDLFRGTDVEVVKDAIQSIDLEKRVALGRSDSTFEYDTLILAVGGETATFGIQGVERFAHDLGSFDGAIKLREHIHDVVADASFAPSDEKRPLLRIVIVGGGATGVELAGELGWYARALAEKLRADPSLVAVDLIEAMPRVLPSLPEAVAQKVDVRLRKLGVNLSLGKTVEKEEADRLVLKDREVEARTIIWTAGLKASNLLSRISGITVDKKGRTLVNEHLELPNQRNVFAIGDCASTTYSGMAQTAIADADHVAKVIRARLMNASEPSAYNQPAPAYAIPVGPKWAAVMWQGMRFYGLVGWFLRRAADFRAFLTILPLPKALSAWWSGTKKIENAE